jgi:hypothetical protein
VEAKINSFVAARVEETVVEKCEGEEKGQPKLTLSGLSGVIRYRNRGAMRVACRARAKWVSEAGVRGDWAGHIIAEQVFESISRLAEGVLALCLCGFVCFAVDLRFFGSGI